MIFSQEPPRARELRRLHSQTAKYTARRTEVERVATACDKWGTLHPEFAVLPTAARIPLLCRAAVFPAIVLFDALFVSQAGQALALAMSGGNSAIGVVGLVGLPFVLALAELTFAYLAEEDFRSSGRLSWRTRLLWTLISLIPMAGGYFAFKGVAAALGVDQDQQALGYVGAALVFLLHVGLVLTAEAISHGLAYFVFIFRNALLHRSLLSAQARLARSRSGVENSWLSYFPLLDQNGLAGARGGPFSVDASRALAEVFGLTIHVDGAARQTNPGPHSGESPDDAAESTQKEGQDNPPAPAASAETIESEWSHITRRRTA